MKSHHCFFQFAAMAALVVMPSSVLRAQSSSGTWTFLGSGTWEATSNWSGGVYADGSGNTADFSQIAWGSSATITLGQPHTLTNLDFGTTGTTSTTTTLVGSSVTLAGTNPTISVANNGSTTDTVLIRSILAGSVGLTKSGNGSLTLDNSANTYAGGTTISGGTLNIGDNTFAGSLGSGNISISSGAILQYVQGVNGATTGTNISNNISGAGSFVKTGITFTAILTGTNTFTGGINLKAGTLVAGADTANYAAGNDNVSNNNGGLSLGVPGTTAAVTMSGAAGTTLALLFNGQNDATSQTLTLFSNFSSLQNSVALTQSGGGGTYTFRVGNNGGTGTNKIISIGGETTLIRNGTLTATGTNAYSLNFVNLGLATGAVNATYTLNPTTASLSVSTLTNSDAFTGGLLDLDGTISGNSITGIIADNSAANKLAVTKSNTSTWTLSGANTFTGGVNINGGALQVNYADVAGTSGALGKSGNITFGGGALQYGPNSTVDYSSRIKNSTGAVSIDTNGQAVNYGVIDNTNSGGLTKLGAGMLTLSGTQGYTGNTSVNGGTLNLTGNNTSSSTTTVNSGGTLIGTGTTSALVLNSGGAISPGSAGATTGGLSAASLMWNSALSSTLTFNLDGGSTNSTNLTLSGVFGKGTGSAFTLDLTQNGDLATPGTYDLINFGSTTFSQTDVNAFATNLGSLSFADGLSGTLLLDTNDKQLDLNVTAAVPEPDTWVLVLCSVILLAGLKRCRQRSPI